MSTYLVCFVVSQFQAIQDDSSGGTKKRKRRKQKKTEENASCFSLSSSGMYLSFLPFRLFRLHFPCSPTLSFALASSLSPPTQIRQTRHVRR